MKKILQVKNLVKYFENKNYIFSPRNKKDLVKAVDDVSFNLNEGEVFILAGGSGSGKSTIAKLILGAIRPDSGKIIFDGKESNIDSKDNLRRLRMNCQMIQQDPYDTINPRMKVLDIISEPLEVNNIGDKQSRKKRILEVLKEVKLEPVSDMINKYPHMLSGGQRQRVVLSRSLVTTPKIIIADEPVSMLDVSIRAEMLEIMMSLQRKHNIAFIYITHDLATARHFGQKIAILYLGKIMEEGSIEDILLDPKHPYTQALIDAISEPKSKNLDKIKKEIRIKEDGHDADVYKGCRFTKKCPYAIEKCSEYEPELKCINDDMVGHNVACFFPQSYNKKDHKH